VTADIANEGLTEVAAALGWTITSRRDVPAPLWVSPAGVAMLAPSIDVEEIITLLSRHGATVTFKPSDGSVGAFEVSGPDGHPEYVLYSQPEGAKSAMIAATKRFLQRQGAVA
jgi:hypothetical protein